MNKTLDTTQGVTTVVPHLLFLFSQAMCGLLLLFLIIPFPYLFLKYFEDITFKLLLQVFPHCWNLILNMFFEMLIISIPLGFAFTEMIFILRKILRKHLSFGKNRSVKDEENGEVLEGRRNVEHFKFRYYLQKDQGASRVWDWELFQYSFLYRVEVVIMVFIICFAIFMVWCLVRSHQSMQLLGDLTYIIRSGSVLVISGCSWYLLRSAKKNKQEMYNSADKALNELLKYDSENQPRYFSLMMCPYCGRGPNLCKCNRSLEIPKCIKCGAELFLNDEFCRECGTVI